MKGTFTYKKTIYDVNQQQFLPGAKNLSPNDGFIIELTLQAFPEEVSRLTLLKSPFVVIEYVKKDVRDESCLTPCQAQDALHRYACDGQVCCVEATMIFDSPTMGRREMIVDLVLPLVDVGRSVYLYYDGVKLAWIQDELINCDMPYGSAVCIDDEYYVCPMVNLRSSGLGGLSPRAECVTEEKNLAYFVPEGYNVWAGDTSAFYHDGTYHLMYLIDRHHHKSRWGGGAHAVMHVTTKDFVNWVQHGELLSLDEQWKTAGTGTMFYHNGKYHYVHGWHTSRVVPEEETGTQILIERGHELINVPITYDEIRGRGFLPCGANLMTSDDGINFIRQPWQFHVAENPCVYTGRDGALTMMAGYGADGEWRADSVLSPWVKIEGFSMTSSAMKPSTECPFLLEAGNYRYLIAGRSGFWMAEYGQPWQDVAIEGIDLYDGLFVPCPIRTDSGRLILSGWLPCGGEWAYAVLHRELVQRPDGRLDERWLPELAPQKSELKKQRADKLEKGKSFYAEFDVDSGQNGVVRVMLSGDERVELRLDAGSQRIQIATVEAGCDKAKTLEPLYEQMGRICATSEAKDCHLTAHDFAIGRADCLTGQYRIKMAVYVEPKMNSTIIDCEIAGARTIVSQRGNVYYDKVIASGEGAKILAGRIYELDT